MAKVKVLIASPYQLVRSALRELLAASSNIEVAGETGVTPKTLAESLRRVSPDVLLIVLDDNAPAELAAVAASVKSTQNVAVLVLSSNENASFVRTAFATGARGYILKAATHAQLESAVRQLHVGRRYIDPRLMDSIADLLLDTARGRRKPPATRPLSAQETRVLRYIARGFTTKEIASECNLSPKTVETYRSRIYEKLGLRGRAELVQYAIAHGLLALAGKTASD